MGVDIYELEGNTALYEVLGLQRGADEKSIRRAYYQLAVLYHPDKNPDGEEIFKEISFAHSILSDPEQRAQYDSQTLKNNLRGRAREYDPTLDPNVELSPEDLRRFVEKMRAAQQQKGKVLDEFMARREEEMKRRAEWDAQHPGFKEAYERSRSIRRSNAAAQARASCAKATGKSAPTSCEASASPSTQFRTSAEMVAKLQKEEENRLYGVSTATSSTPSTTLPSIKMQLMAQFRSKASGRATSSDVSPSAKVSLPFVDQQERAPSYYREIQENIRTHSNFDYLAYVEKDMSDTGSVSKAIMADALHLYDREH